MIVRAKVIHFGNAGHFLPLRSEALLQESATEAFVSVALNRLLVIPIGVGILGRVWVAVPAELIVHAISAELAAVPPIRV